MPSFLTSADIHSGIIGSMIMCFIFSFISGFTLGRAQNEKYYVHAGRLKVYSMILGGMGVVSLFGVINPTNWFYIFTMPAAALIFEIARRKFKSK